MNKTYYQIFKDVIQYHIPLREQEDPAVKTPPVKEPPPEDPTADPAAEEDPTAETTPEDPAAAEAGADEAVPEEPAAEEPLPEDEPSDPTDIGNAYRLKKVYLNMRAVSKLLDSYSDSKVEMLKRELNEAMEMFHIIVVNYELYKENVEDILSKYSDIVKKTISEFDIIIKEINSDRNEE